MNTTDSRSGRYKSLSKSGWIGDSGDKRHQWLNKEMLSPKKSVRSRRQIKFLSNTKVAKNIYSAGQRDTQPMYSRRRLARNQEASFDVGYNVKIDVILSASIFHVQDRLTACFQCWPADCISCLTGILDELRTNYYRRSTKINATLDDRNRSAITCTLTRHLEPGSKRIESIKSH
jgi:hypothetical protein